MNNVRYQDPKTGEFVLLDDDLEWAIEVRSLKIFISQSSWLAGRDSKKWQAVRSIELDGKTWLNSESILALMYPSLARARLLRKLKDIRQACLDFVYSPDKDGKHEKKKKK